MKHRYGIRQLKNKTKEHTVLKTMLMLFCILTMTSSAAFAAEVFTDRADYPPGDSVVIIGVAFQPNETVTVQITHLNGGTPSTPEYDPWDNTADGYGDFETFWIVPEDALGETLQVTATGQSSGLTASSIFTDKSTELSFTTVIPNPICPGTTLDVCASLFEKCSGGFLAPLENRELLFFLNPGNCGVNVGQVADATVFTDANGNACATLTMPTTPGDYSIRVKFLGEAKPGPGDPANSACSAGSKVQLSASNVCEITTVDPSACNEPPTCSVPADQTFDQCTPTQVSLPVSCYDPDGNLAAGYPIKVSGPGSIVGGNWVYTPTGDETAVVTIRCQDDLGAYCEATFTITFNINNAPTATCLGNAQIFVCDLSPITLSGFICDDVDGDLVSCTVDNGSLVGNDVTFTPVAGINNITLTATDACGAVATCQTTITVTVNSAPTATCPGDDQLFVCDLSPITLSGFICDDIDGNLSSCAVNNGTLTGNDVTFTPVAGVNTITLTATDACGEVTTCQTTITVIENSAPTATCPGDAPMFVCDFSPITVSGFICDDIDGNLSSCMVNNGTLTGNDVTFTPVAGVNTITLTATDACGEVTTCQTTITVIENSAPTATCPGDAPMFVCDLSPITISGFICDDVDGNLATCAVDNGSLVGNDVTFTPVAGANTITLTATDDCGEVTTCQTTITVTVNSPPTVTCKASADIFLCSLAPITFTGFSCNDVDGNLVSCEVDNGVLVGNSVTITPVEGVNIITLTATDACGEVTTCQTVKTVTVNSPPTATCPGDDQMFVCDLSPITLSGFICDDVDGNLTDCSVDNGTLTGNDVTFTPVVGANTITLTARDACNKVTTCQTTITIAMNSAPTATCPGDDQLFVCDLSPITIPGFICDDVDGNLVSCAVNNGTLTGNDVTFTPVAGVNTIILTATDVCGEVATCQTTITVTVNSAPTATCPADDQIFVCNLSPITLAGFICDDVDGNLVSCNVSIGTLTGNDVTFTPVCGVNTITMTATDACGEVASCQTTITVTCNSAPTATCPGDDQLFVCDLSPITIAGFICDDADGNLTSCVVDNGTLTGNDVTFTPVCGVNTITLTATDACGEVASCQTTITVNCNNAPTATCPGDDQLFVCDLSPKTISGFVCDDVDGNLVSCTVDNGTLNGSDVTFTPVVGANIINLTATDACGDAATCQTIITVSMNTAPTATCPGDEQRDVCDLSPITLSGFICDDVDGNLVTCVVNNGTLTGNDVTFTPVVGANVIILTATDACGEIDVCQTTVNVTLNSPPVAECPASKDMFVCDLDPITITGFRCNDPDNNLTDCAASVDTDPSAVLSSGSVTFTPIEGVNTITLTATDACGETDVCQVTVTVTLNSPPVAHCPGDRTIFVSDLSEICIPGFYCDDVDNNLVSCVPNVGYLDGDKLCFIPVEGNNELIITATDACGAGPKGSHICVTNVNVVIVQGCPLVTISTEEGVLQGHYRDVTVTIENATYEMGGYDFLIAYDASALSFMNAEPLGFYDYCNWEYFTYRYGANGNCGNSCPSGVLRVFALAETNDGINNPTCLGPPDQGVHDMFVMRFFVTNDRTFECQFVPISFHWHDCGDNSISGPTGDKLYIDLKIYDAYGNLIWDEDDDVQFPDNARPTIPSFLGAPDFCLDNPMPGKPTAIRCIDFQFGGINIICADDIDARGDLNLNGISNEIADAVVFTNYFIHGLDAFVVNVEGQIAASDANADGISLSVADLVYIIRVINGDVQPIDKIIPYESTVGIGFRGSVIVADADLGAAAFVFEGNVNAELTANSTHMKIKSSFDGVNTRVVIYSFEKGDVFSGDILQTDGKMLSIEASDYYGNLYKIVELPQTFSLNTYPNPFNPSTAIEMSLPIASDWTVDIYNVSGQKIGAYNGTSEAGLIKITWDAAGQSSGIYFIKAQAGKYNATKKVILLK